jgi:phage host-nuclease inhibitor protein Gam
MTEDANKSPVELLREQITALAAELAEAKAETKTVLDREAATIARYDTKLAPTEAEIEAAAKAICCLDEVDPDALCDRYRDEFTEYGEYHGRPAWHRWRSVARASIIAAASARTTKGE